MKILSIDAETNGLYGQIFAIGGIYKDTISGEEIRYSKRVSIVEDVNPWVAENVLPHVQDIEQLDKTVDDDVYGVEKTLLKDFRDFYLECKKKTGNNFDLLVIGHMVCPVEANLFIKMKNYELIGDFEGPFPLHDVASMLLMAGENTTSVDIYVEKHKLENTEGSIHNPLFDCEQALKVFIHLSGEK